MKRLFAAALLSLISLLASAQIAPDYIRHPASVCTSHQYLQYTATSGTPATCSQVAYADVTGTPTIPTVTGGACTNQFVRSINGSAVPTCATVANADIANSTIDLTTKVTGVLPIANIATGTPTGSKFVRDDGTLAVPPGSSAVSSVFTRTGAVTAQSGDYTAAQVGLGNVTNDAQTKAAMVPNTAPSAGQILVGNAGGTAYAPVTASGDVSIASTGAVTVVNSAITNAKLANMAAHTMKANNTGGAAAASDIALSTFVSTYCGGIGSVYLDGSGNCTTPSATGGTGWVDAFDCDFSAQSNQTLSTDGDYTICTAANGASMTWTKASSTNDSTAMAVVNGSGLVAVPKATTNYSGSTRTAPNLYTDVAAVVPGYYPTMPIQAWVYISTDNINANNDQCGMFLDNMTNTAAPVMTQTSAIRENLSGVKTFDFRSNGTALTVGGLLDNTDRVMLIDGSLGRIGPAILMFVSTAAWSGGWPTRASMRPFATRVFTSSTVTWTNSQDNSQTMLPQKIGVFPARNSSATALSCTFARIRLQYQAR